MLAVQLQPTGRRAVPDVCVDCSVTSRPTEVVPCFSESFPLKTTNGGQFTLTLRLCLRCGARFADRSALRSYLVTKLPAYAAFAAA
jgi:hypothetical protein